MQTSFRSFALVASATLLGACASSPIASPVASISAPATLVPAGEVAFTQVAARGVQIYECRARSGGAAEWAFVAPEAQLLDARGAVVGRHYAGPHWEAGDGSKIVGTVKARADAPRAGAVAWLLLGTRSDGTEGRWSRVSSVQRLNTAGGLAPKDGCDANAIGRTVHVPYTADYVMFVPR